MFLGFEVREYVQTDLLTASRVVDTSPTRRLGGERTATSGGESG